MYFRETLLGSLRLLSQSLKSQVHVSLKQLGLVCSSLSAVLQVKTLGSWLSVILLRRSAL